MAIAATAVWRIRPGGNDANGGGYDATSYPGGTDYSQQDSAQASWTNLSCTGSASTTLTDAGAGGLFTAAMVGNAIRITGGSGFSAGWYFIASVTNSNAVVLDASPASSTSAASAGAGKVGGGVYSYPLLLAGGRGANAGAAPGNIIYVRGAGSSNPTAADYTVTSYGGYSNGGSSTGGMVTLMGENGRPWIDTNQSGYGGSYYRLQNLKFRATSVFSYGVIEAGNSIIRNCIFDQNGYDVKMIGSFGGVCTENEFFSSVAGSGGSSPAISFTNNSYFAFNHVHNTHGPGVQVSPSAGVTLSANVIARCGGDGVFVSGSSYFGPAIIMGNTIVANLGNGVNFDTNSISVTSGQTVADNLITDHVSSGKAGINVPGSIASNLPYAALFDQNLYWNNTSNVSGLNPGANDVLLTGSPYNGSSTDDWSIVSALQGTAPVPAGFMQHLSGKTALSSYMSPGALQPTPASSSSTTLTLARAEIYNVA